MRIVCPSCGAAYDVPEQRLAPGRLVGCARCTTQWTPIPAPPLAPRPPPPPMPAARTEPKLERLAVAPVVPVPTRSPAQVQPVAPLVTAPPRPARRNQGAAIAWVASVVVLVALAGVAYANREAIVHAWPPSERAYAALGIQVRASGPP